MGSIRNKTVAEFVTQNIHTANIFKKYDIDFCCDGSISIEKACAVNNVDFNQLEKELNNLHSKTNFLTDYNNWELDFLMIFIVHVHHVYVRNNIPKLKMYLQKANEIDGEKHKELNEITDLILKISDGLMTHLKEEETKVFPFIKKMILAKKEGQKITNTTFNSLDTPIKKMEENHEKADGVFKRISKLTNKYKAPENASKRFKALYIKLQEFENNLQQHVHLENNILFPKAKKLELEVIKK